MMAGTGGHWWALAGTGGQWWALSVVSAALSMRDVSEPGYPVTGDNIKHILFGSVDRTLVCPLPLF
jgi:hypothetical protein